MKSCMSLSTEKYVEPILREHVIEERRQARREAHREMMTMFLSGTALAFAIVAWFQAPAINTAIRTWWLST